MACAAEYVINNRAAGREAVRFGPGDMQEGNTQEANEEQEQEPQTTRHLQTTNMHTYQNRISIRQSRPGKEKWQASLLACPRRDINCNKIKH